MRGTGLAAIVVALVWTSGAASSTPGPKPHLRLVDRAPLRLHGTHFRGRERVRVTVVATQTLSRTALTKRDGSFTTEFDGAGFGRCGGGLSVQAVGARGDHASLKVLQPEDCAPGLGP